MWCNAEFYKPRLSRLRLEGYPDGDEVYFCEDCDFQYPPVVLQSE